MKKFVFSLEKVLGLKNQMLDVLINEQIQLQNQLKLIEQEIEDLKSIQNQCNEELIELLSTGICSQQIMSYKIYFSSLGQQIVAAMKRRNIWEDAVKRKKDELITMKSEISGYEKLKEKQKETYRVANQKAQELVIEEFVSQSYNFS